MKNIEVNKIADHYEIGVNGQFYCSCDDMREVRDEIAKIEQEDK